MAELNKVARCYRCGAILQTTDQNADGYISPEIVDKYPEGLLLCNDCFKNERFNTSPKEPHFEDAYQTILETIKETKAVIAYVVDLYSFEGSFISKLNEMIKGLDVLVIANKRDLLPKEADDNALLEYVAHRLRVANLEVKDVVLTSSNDELNIDLMYEKICQIAQNRDVYFIGASVSGKSSLISLLLKNYINNTRRPVTVCTFKNTDIRGFKIPLTDKTYIYELPGTDIQNSLLSKVERVVQNQIAPKKAVKARKVSLVKGSSVALGGLCVVELLNGPKTDITIYASNLVEVKMKRWTGEKHLQAILKKQICKPTSANYTQFNEFDAYDFQITEEGQRDVGILGLGWFNFKAKGQTFRIFIPKGVYVYTTRSKVTYVKK